MNERSLKDISENSVEVTANNSSCSILQSNLQIIISTLKKGLNTFTFLINLNIIIN